MNSKGQNLTLVCKVGRVTDCGSIRRPQKLEGKIIQIYTVRFPMEERNTLMSGWVMSSGYIPPVSSKSAHLSRLSELGNSWSKSHENGQGKNTHIPNLSATPGRYRRRKDVASVFRHERHTTQYLSLPACLDSFRIRSSLHLVQAHKGRGGCS